MSKITIWIATHITNPTRRNYLYEAIDAVLNQSNSNWELILSDDSSSIDVDWNRTNDSRIKVFHHTKPLGIFWNFNFCLQNTSTELFFPLGDDDVVDINFVDRVLSYFKEDTQDTDIICFNYHCTRSSGEVYSSSNMYDTFHFKWIDSMNDSITKTYSGWYLRMMFHSVWKTEKLKKIGWYPDYGMVTDGLLNYIFPLSFNIWFLEDYLINIRHHELNLWGVNNLDILRKEKIELNNYIEGQYEMLLSSQNRDLFEKEKIKLQTDHVHLLIVFKENWRMLWIREFFKHKITTRNIVILIFGIIFWRKIHKYFIFFTKYYTEASYKILSFFKH